MFKCEITGGLNLEWAYISTQNNIAQINKFPPPNPVMVAGVEFTVFIDLLSTEISFVPTLMMNDTALACHVVYLTSIQYGVVTLRVQNISKLVYYYNNNNVDSYR